MVEFRATTNSPVAVYSGWSAGNPQSFSTHDFVTAVTSTTTVAAKLSTTNGLLILGVEGKDWHDGKAAFACEILVDGKTVAHQQSPEPFGLAHCLYRPRE